MSASSEFISWLLGMYHNRHSSKCDDVREKGSYLA